MSDEATKPRVLTIGYQDGQVRLYGSGELREGERVKVLEAEPVLDLLERADTALMYADSGEAELRAEIDTLLRKRRRSDA